MSFGKVSEELFTSMDSSSSSSSTEDSLLFGDSHADDLLSGLNKYEVLGEIGKGGQGQVFKVKKRDSLLKNKDTNEELILKKRICITLEEANEALQEVKNLHL